MPRAIPLADFLYLIRAPCGSQTFAPGGPLLSAAVLAFAASFAAGAAILASSVLHGHLTGDWLDGVQKVHARPTPRIGGLALAAGLAAGAAMTPGGMVWAILAAAVPAMVWGLAEDLTGAIGPGARLAATLASGLCLVQMTGIVIGPDLPWPAGLLAMPGVAVAVTAFAVGGTANAVNLIDGFHGLAAGTVLIALTGLGLAAAAAGDGELCAAIAVAGGALAGFLLFNYPHGRIFLGDGGAYLAGVLLAAFAVALPARNAGLSPLVGLMAVAYPVTETLVSILRRRLAGARASAADGGHLHSLLHRTVAEPVARGAGAPALANPLTAALIWPFGLMGAALTVAGSVMPVVLVPGLALTVALYLVAYGLLVRAADRAAGGAGAPIRAAQPVPVALRPPALRGPAQARDAA